MMKHNAEKERIQRAYFAYLKEASRYSDQTVDAVAKALARFEQYNKLRDFKAFHYQQAVAFKHHLAEQRAHRRRVVAAGQQLLPDRSEANHRAADVEVVEQETLNVIGLRAHRRSPAHCA